MDKEEGRLKGKILTIGKARRGERGKFCSQTNLRRSAVTHILKKKGCNSVREPLIEAPLSQRGALSL